LGLAGGTPSNLIYIDGEPNQKLTNENLVDNLERLIRAKAAQKQAQMDADARNIIAKG
jgi:(E)-4-hydroxy-3-methylbut-2-enyl-diphosphate synthase